MEAVVLFQLQQPLFTNLDLMQSNDENKILLKLKDKETLICDLTYDFKSCLTIETRNKTVERIGDMHENIKFL